MRFLRSLAETVVVLCLISEAALAVTVTVSSPASANVPTTFSVVAGATSGHPVTGWVIYVDGASAWQTPGPTSSIAANITVAAGPHNLVVRAWDSTGAYGSAFVSLNAAANSTPPPAPNPQPGPQPSPQPSAPVMGNRGIPNAAAPPPASSSSSGVLIGSDGLPIPPASATVFDRIEDTSADWYSCSICAGGRTTSTFWMAPFQTTPSLDGASRQFFNGGAPWSNVLWYKRLGKLNSASHFLWDLYIRFDSGAAAGLHVAEMDIFQAINGYEWMMGSQCNFGDGWWDTWDQAAGAWVASDVRCPRFSPDTWHHVQWYIERVGTTQYRYNLLVVDGVKHPMNRIYGASRTAWEDVLGVQWQFDLGPEGIPAHVWIDKVKLTAW